jgi:hypothetical protein
VTPERVETRDPLETREPLVTLGVLDLLEDAATR